MPDPITEEEPVPPPAAAVPLTGTATRSTSTTGSTITMKNPPPPGKEYLAETTAAATATAAAPPVPKTSTLTGKPTTTSTAAMAPYTGVPLAPAVATAVAPAVATANVTAATPSTRPPTSKSTAKQTPHNPNSSRRSSSKGTTTTSTTPATKKRGRGRPPKAGGPRSTTKPTPSRTKSIGSHSRKQQQQQQQGPHVSIISDDHVRRVVNPLLELPPASSSSSEGALHAAELWTVYTDLVFCPPDTYPLSYYGRLLGLPIPPSFGRAFPQELQVEHLPFPDRSQDVFYQIPPVGPRYHPTSTPSRPCHNTPTTPTTTTTGGGDDDDAMLDYMDPVYAHFLQEGFDRSRCKPVTPTLATRMAAHSTREASKVVHEEILNEAAHGCSLDTPTWTFEEWKPTEAEWTLDEHRVCVGPPMQSFGVVARHEGGIPMFLLHYKFQWYPMKESKESELVLILEGLTKRSGTVAPKLKSPSPPVATMGEETSMKIDPAATAPAATTKTPPEMTDGIPPPSSPLPESLAGLEPAASVVAEVSQPKVVLPDVDLPEAVRWMMLTLALEHARAADVWYCLWNAPPNMVRMAEHCFRMTRLPLSSRQQQQQQQQHGNTTMIPMVGDMKKCSWKYAVLKFRQGIPNDTPISKQATTTTTTAKEDAPVGLRVLVKLPLEEEARASLDAAYAETQRSKRALLTNADSMDFTGATGATRDIMVGLRATLSGQEGVRLQQWSPNSSSSDAEKAKDLVLKPVVEGQQQLAPLEILRKFPLPNEAMPDDEDNDDEILKELKEKQALLATAETALQPKIRALMHSVMEERLEYESADARAKREENRRILKAHANAVARRKELDLAEQEQREQDMNAVCSICNDGEVTPDNQILFCEACDVPVHQFCYGIEEIPEGDYYCIACRHFNRDKMSKEQNRTSSTGARIALPPLPINCELCPIKKGAYVRSDTSQSAPNATISKWVHMACAKWQGLNFIIPDKPDLVEDVGELKKFFRRMDIECDICRGKRGAYHKCRHPECNKYLHLSCARALGVCEVIHGEDVEGPVESNPWTLLCAEHTNLDPENLPQDPMPLERLIELSKELPNDPMPDPLPVAHKPFNKLNGKERVLALRDPVYERQFLDEILNKRFAGSRCEVCWTMEDDGKNLARCSDCQAVICFSCRLSDKGEVNPDQKYFKCFACRFVRDMGRGETECERPQCAMCNQKNGLLLKSVAKPTKMTHWKNNSAEYDKTIFARDLWTHYTCGFWLTHAGLHVDGEACEVNLSNVVMSNGRGFVKAKQICDLCGLTDGLKAGCGDSNCRARGEKRQSYRFHVTCARAAGYEVDEDGSFFVKCYFHGACEYNLRARLEDFLEVEKRRAGKTYSRSGGPMTFSDGSRLLNQATMVMRMLGWAWRWAEHWVEWGSNWEPLLEEGQKEEKMTKKQLKIVDSTPESRAEDARRCRLAAFGAALRNRAYDTDDGFDNESLQKALTSILSTPSLCGPLKPYEISLASDWLSRAYRSKSKHLGFGQDKIPVANDGFCLHSADRSPKYELGDRALPGKAPLGPGQLFESQVEEPDDFLLPELSADGSKCSLPANSIREVKRKVFKFRKPKPGEVEESDDDVPAKTVHTKPEKKIAKKESIVVASSKKKVGRPSKDEQKKVPSRSEFVAAMVPSAVKKRGENQLGRGRSGKIWTPLATKSHPKIVKTQISSPMTKILFSKKKELGVPTATARVVYQDLLDADNEESVLRKVGRRGRPPKIIDFLTYVKVNNIDYDPGNSSSDLSEERKKIEDLKYAVNSSAAKTPRKETSRSTLAEPSKDDLSTSIAGRDESIQAHAELTAEPADVDAVNFDTPKKKRPGRAKSKDKVLKRVDPPRENFPGRVRRSIERFVPTIDPPTPRRSKLKPESEGRGKRRRGLPPSNQTFDNDEDEEYLPHKKPRGRPPSPKKGPGRPPNSGKKRGRPPKQEEKDESFLVGETLAPADAEVYVMRGRGGIGCLSPGTPSPSKKRLRRSARSPGRALLDEEKDQAGQGE